MRAENAELPEDVAAKIICNFSTPKFMNFTDLDPSVTTSADNFPLQPSFWASENTKNFKQMGKKL